MSFGIIDDVAHLNGRKKGQLRELPFIQVVEIQRMTIHFIEVFHLLTPPLFFGLVTHHVCHQLDKGIEAFAPLLRLQRPAHAKSKET